jgi:antitoxin component YwqK of YwqJK toxin-antitoxin module
MIKSAFTIVLSLGLALTSFCQQLTLVKDSIMSNYMQSGFSNTHFIPKGKKDSNGLKQGKWEDYEVAYDYVYVTLNRKPTQVYGHYLLFGEGEYINGKREGRWTLYVIEDKTFKKLRQQEVSYTKGVKDGLFTYVFPNGKTGVTGKYVANKTEGEVKSYYEDGKLYGTRYYEGGLRTGRHTYLHPNGQLKLEHHFTNDTLNGDYRTYYPDGKVQERFTYLMGKEDGIYSYYYGNGQLWIEKEYNNGLLMNVTGSYDTMGNPRDKGTIKDGNGTVNYFTEEGKLYAVQTFRDGKKIGEENK